MSEFNVKVPGEWKHIKEELPEVGKPIEVLCTMITRASLVGLDPKQMWQQEGDMSEAQTEVKLWREIEQDKSMMGSTCEDWMDPITGKSMEKPQ